MRHEFNMDNVAGDTLSVMIILVLAIGFFSLLSGATQPITHETMLWVLVCSLPWGIRVITESGLFVPLLSVVITMSTIKEWRF